MTNAQTPHSRKLRQTTAAAWVKGQVARGGCRLSLVLPPDAKARLDRMVARYGTKKRAICAALALADGGKLADGVPTDCRKTEWRTTDDSGGMTN